MPNDFANPRNGDGFGANTGRRVSLGGNDAPVDPSTGQPLPVLYPEDARPRVPLRTRQGETHDGLPEDDEDE
jgi:hypothetical protein